MFKIHQQLNSPADFDNAMFLGVPVTVYQESEIIDYGGVIEKHTEDCVYINGGHFIKENCQFKVRRASIAK
ncbi:MULTISPECIES: hypothetical protein [unclassified Paenibacillus]|uniref:hypothetical protein n=1 Tax=unclassified Paenibacillus TaxID=185978 RepID=UPI003630BA1B